MNEVILHIRESLKAAADEKTRAGSRRFFKETLNCYGVKTPAVNQISKEHFKKVNSLPKAVAFTLIEDLWQSGVHEESIVACNWTYSLRRSFAPEDFLIFSRWINSYVHNWASCDTFCNHSVGEFLQMYPEFLDGLKRFTSSENRWMKRAAAVSLIVPARKGLFLDTIFEIADALLKDPDDLVQKGYGWVLKAASQVHEQQVFDYVMKHQNDMPRTALRYAIEKMPKELKMQAMGR